MSPTWLWMGYCFFWFVKNERRTDYIATNVENPTRSQIENIMKMRWNIEVYHRELKPCGIECCLSRSGRAQRNRICIAVLVWIYRFKKRLVELMNQSNFISSPA